MYQIVLMLCKCVFALQGNDRGKGVDLVQQAEAQQLQEQQAMTQTVDFIMKCVNLFVRFAHCRATTAAKASTWCNRWRQFG